MAYLEKSTIADVKNSQLFGVFPGDSQDRDFSSITNRVYIMPPFGSDENIIIIRLAITCVIVLTVVVTIFILILQKGRKWDKGTVPLSHFLNKRDTPKNSKTWTKGTLLKFKNLNKKECP